jgi:RNA polymerase sigma factor for flagellar operon FliA
VVNGDEEESTSLIEVLAASDDPYEELVEREQVRALNEAFNRLSERERLVIALYYYEGLTFKEIGQVLNISESRVYQLHTRAIARMREMLCGTADG